MAGCAHRGTVLPVRWSPLYVLSSGRPLASNERLGLMEFTLSCEMQHERERERRFSNVVYGTHLMYKLVMYVERMGDFLCPYHHQPIVVQPWKSAATGKVGQVERVDYRYILPVELTFSQKLWRVLISLFSWLCDPAVGAVCHFVNVCKTHRNWQLDMSLVGRHHTLHL